MLCSISSICRNWSRLFSFKEFPVSKIVRHKNKVLLSASLIILLFFTVWPTPIINAREVSYHRQYKEVFENWICIKLLLRKSFKQKNILIVSMEPKDVSVWFRIWVERLKTLQVAGVGSVPPWLAYSSAHVVISRCDTQTRPYVTQSKLVGCFWRVLIVLFVVRGWKLQRAVSGKHRTISNA